MDYSAYQSLLKVAISREEEAFHFYTEVSALLENASLKMIFDELAQEEKAHHILLDTFLDHPELSLSFPETFDFDISQEVPFPQLSVTMKPSEAIALAMKKEQQAVEFYTRLAEQTADPQIRDKCLELAKMETIHKGKLENIYTDIAYAETF